MIKNNFETDNMYMAWNANKIYLMQYTCLTFLFCFVCLIFDSSHIILSCIGLSLITIPSKLIFSIDEMNFTTLLIKEKGKYHTVGTIPISYRKIVVFLLFDGV